MTDELDIQVFYSSEEMDLLKSRIAELEVQLAALKEGECAKEELDKLKIENSALANTIELARKDFNELQAENERLLELIDEILNHALANRDTEHEFFVCYTYGGRAMPEWVQKAKAALREVE